MRMYPELEVYVHERGAPHMVNPERLWASASQLYGEANMLAMWGEFVPVPEERMHVLAGGETLTIAGDTFEVAYTPGHAKHHVSYLHRGHRLRRRRRRRPDRAGNADAASDAPSRHRHRGVAQLDRA